MSKVKTNRLEPRTNTGTLTIGNPDSATMFEGEVNIPEYATTEWVIGIITDDIQPELAVYQKKDEKNAANGYCGLESDARVATSRINIDGIENEVQSLVDQVSDNTSNITGLGTQVNQNTSDIAQIDPENFVEKTGDSMTGTLTLDSPKRDIDVTSGTAGHLTYAGVDKVRWGSKVFIDAEFDGTGHRIGNISNPLEDYDAATKYYVDNASADLNHPVKIHVPYTSSGEVVFGVYAEMSRSEAIEAGFDPDVDAEGPPGAPRSEYALFRVMGDGKLWGFNYLKGLSGTPAAEQDATNKEYVDGKVAALSMTIDEQYMALSGGTDHKSTGNMYMGGHRITGLSHESEHSSDAISYNAGDGRYVMKATFEAMESRIASLEARLKDDGK